MRAGWLLAAIIVIGLANPAVPTLAQECGPLKIVASVDLASSPDERAVFVPVMLQDQKKLLLLDTGGMIGELTPATVSALGLESHKTSGVRLYDVKGNFVDHETVVPNFAIGTLTGHNVDFMVGPDDLFKGNDEIAGILGPGILRYYDVAMDFAGKKLVLLSQDHCEGKVIYWRADAVAVVPMQVTRVNGHIVVPVTLDGHALDAIIDTGASTSTLNQTVAEGDFKLNDKTGMTAIGRMGDRAGSLVYRHTFTSLSFEGLAVANPVLDIVPDLQGSQMERPPPIGTRIPDRSIEQKMPDLLIGMDILRHLHVYIAYREQKLYLTPASTAAATDKGLTNSAAAKPAGISTAP
jgi:hypothetical protein